MTIERDNQGDGEKEIALPQVEETELEPVEVDLGEEGTEQQAEPPQPKPEDDVGQAPRRRDSAKGRINQLTRKAREAETVAERLTRENHELRAANEQVRKEAMVSNRAALIHYEARVKSDVDRTRKSLQDAQAAGDPEQISKASEDLMAAKAEQQQLDSWKSANPQQQQQEQPQQRQPQVPQQEQPRLMPDEALQSWMDENPWFVGSQGNTEFDPDMHQEAVAYATMLERKYMRQGKQAEIGTKAYYDEVNKHMQGEFPEYFGDEEPAPTPPARRNPPMQTNRQNGVVAAANGGAVNNGGARSTSNKVSLTSDERKFAHNMAANGAYMVGNRKATPQEAERMFGLQKLNQKNGAQ